MAELVRITRAQLDEVREMLLVKQNYLCALCRQPFNSRDWAVVDHDHYTGLIRGVIHNSCNGAEGNLIVKANLCHKGVKPYPFLISLGEYLRLHTETPQTRMIHPLHHMPNEREGVPPAQRRWRK
jgi:hypothetical protein